MDRAAPRREWEHIAEHLRSVAQEHGVMGAPRVDWETHQLVEGSLRIDMLNVYHCSRQLRHPEADRVVQTWIAPKHLGNACYFGRVDAVREMLAHGASPDGGVLDAERVHPITAAKEAWVTTPLHVECVRALLEAGAALTEQSFRLNPDAVGSDVDFDILELLVEHGVRRADPSVRQLAEQTDLAALRAFIRRMRTAVR